MDALGSLRGVVNPTGEVLEGQHYAPYGTSFGHTGTAQTVFGFTGEITDASGLVYLRARYYLPTLGVFPSLDPVEEGNRYGYVGGNPVNYTDHAGAIPDRSDIQSQQKNNPKYIYSCNCGWIDWRHANPQITAVRVLAQIGDVIDFFKQNPGERFVAFSGEFVQHDIGVPYLGPQDTFRSPVVFDSTQINEGNWLNYAMALFREVEWAHENSFWSHLGAITPTWTQFSEEDLASDLLAFYRALDKKNFDPANAFSVLAPICGFPNDFEECKKWSLDVFDTYGGFQQVGAWENPRLISTPAISSYCNRFAARQWPWQLKAIQPAQIQHYPLQPAALNEVFFASKNRSGVLHFLPKSLKSDPPYIGIASALKPLDLFGC